MKIKLPVDTGRHLFVGLGAETNTTLCHASGRTAVISDPYPDLRDVGTLEAFERKLSLILSQSDEVTLACDLHPQYTTTALAERISSNPEQIVRVQHHHAHIASCMAESSLDEEVIGLAFDGTGYGEDGTIWGMEFLIVSPGGYRRLGHLRYTPMPGGDMAVREPYRMAISYLYHAFGETLGGLRKMYEELFGEEKVAAIIELIESRMYSPLSSSCGRLFDAVASILGICQISEGKAEGPRGLEELADRRETQSYGHRIRKDSTMHILDLSEAFANLSDDLKKGISKSKISARFHNTVAYAAADIALAISEEAGIKKVAISGGVFANKLLSSRLTSRLSKNGLEPIIPHGVSPTDAGISLGQVYVAINQMR